MVRYPERYGQDCRLATILTAEISTCESNRHDLFFLCLDDFVDATDEIIGDFLHTVLAVFGGKDVQVRPDLNRPALEAAFAKGGHIQPTVTLYSDANHLFMAATSGQPSEYASLPKVFVPGFLDDATRWLLAVR